ncbi:MAG: branched-chain amino acid ABC transporter permease [Chloroflexi bacterium]|nr:branched-chain amino acid ABC transporter permease [Chloroflexota bacterium]
MTTIIGTIRKNRTQTITLAALILSFLLAIQGMETGDWIITILRGLSVAAVTFLVASGFSLIFGLMDVLNLAHGTLFMIGAYVGWTAYVRPDTLLDLATPAALFFAGLLLLPLWDRWLSRVRLAPQAARGLPWLALALGVGALAFGFARYPITGWDVTVYDKSPVVFGVQLDLGQLDLPAPAIVGAEQLGVSMLCLFAGGGLIALGLTLLESRNRIAAATTRVPWRALLLALGLALGGLALFAWNDALTAFLVAAGTTWRFLIAVIVATLVGAGLGALMESTLIRPLYTRPIYQLMLTLGLGVIGREVVIALWGRTQMQMPKPALFNTIGQGCPAQTIFDALANQCSTISFMGSRIRTYNEIFIFIVGVIVLIVVWLLLQRTRIGMIIRAGVQDRAMVEALGINVRQVFTFVFALGVGLAALGGVLAGPSMGVSDDMGESLLLSALIALAIGGLTSFPGAAAGSLLVGLLQQFIVKYGQIGIALPFLEQPFKPTPPLVPASTLLLMVIILLALPNGLFGRKE